MGLWLLNIFSNTNIYFTNTFQKSFLSKIIRKINKRIEKYYKGTKPKQKKMWLQNKNVYEIYRFLFDNLLYYYFILWSLSEFYIAKQYETMSAITIFSRKEPDTEIVDRADTDIVNKHLKWICLEQMIYDSIVYMKTYICMNVHLIFCLYVSVLFNGIHVRQYK